LEGFCDLLLLIPNNEEKSIGPWVWERKELMSKATGEVAPPQILSLSGREEAYLLIDFLVVVVVLLPLPCGEDDDPDAKALKSSSVSVTEDCCFLEGLFSLDFDPIVRLALIGFVGVPPPPPCGGIGGNEEEDELPLIFDLDIV
jgi:hypothetical protein